MAYENLLINPLDNSLIAPEDSGKSILKNTSGTLGTSGVPWDEVNTQALTAKKGAVINEDGNGNAADEFRVESADRQRMIGVDVVSNKVHIGADASYATADGRLKVEQFDSSGAMPVIHLRQADTDKEFIMFEGTEGEHFDTSITTLLGGGAVDGPKLASGPSGSEGWAFAKMVMVKIGNTTYYMPLYIPNQIA